MPFCPQCGTSNPDGARFCQACGTQMPQPGSPASPPGGGPTPGSPGAGSGPRPGSTPPSAPGFGSGSGPSGYGTSGYGAPGYPPGAYGTPVRRKNPSAAAAWGLLWGFGAQAFYNGQPLKGVLQIVLNLLIMWPMLTYMGGGGAWIVGLGVAAIFMYDGYKVAQKINAGEPVGPWTFF